MAAAAYFTAAGIDRSRAIWFEAVRPSLDEALRRIDDQGWVVLEDVAPIALFDDLARALAPLLEATPTGRNSFEGHRTRRVYNLLSHGRVFERVAENESILSVSGGVLGAHFQLSISSAAEILPGENDQDLHTDDALFPLPRPHPPVVLNTMWAVTEFTFANGATRLVPGSHHWTHSRPPRAGDPVIAAEMPRGSVLVWVGNLWHGGGANTTASARLGVTTNYNQGWLRQQENQYLAIPRETVLGFSERLQRLVGYDVHPPFTGNVEGRNPIRLVRGPERRLPSPGPSPRSGPTSPQGER